MCLRHRGDLHPLHICGLATPTILAHDCQRQTNSNTSLNKSRNSEKICVYLYKEHVTTRWDGNEQKKYNIRLHACLDNSIRSILLRLFFCLPVIRFSPVHCHPVGAVSVVSIQSVLDHPIIESESMPSLSPFQVTELCPNWLWILFGDFFLVSRHAHCVFLPLV